MNKLKILSWNIKQKFHSANFHRDMRTVLFGAWFGNRFSDNPRFLYQYLSDNKETLGLNHVVWVTRNQDICNRLNNMGYEAYMMDSDESISFHKKAGIHIVCNGASDNFQSPRADILGRYSVGAVKINLWHGLCGIKGFGFLSNEYINKKKNKPLSAALKEFIHKVGVLRRNVVSLGGWGDCYYLSTTDYVTDIFKRICLSPEKNYIKSGYPRNCVDVKLLESENEIINRLKGYRFRIMYLPTFRESVENYTPPLEFDGIKKWLAENTDILWIEKVHSADKNIDFSSDETADNIMHLNSDFDIDLLMPQIDLLITDYSSAAFDAMYFDKSVLYYTPDFDYYMNDDRGFITDPECFIAGIKACDETELVSALKKETDNPGYVKNENYQKIRKSFWGKKTNISEIWEDICRYCNIQ